MTKKVKQPEHWFWDSTWPWLRKELTIAAMVAGATTVVVLARRWLFGLLDLKVLNEQFFSTTDSPVRGALDELIGTMEKRYTEGERHARTSRKETPSGSNPIDPTE